MTKGAPLTSWTGWDARGGASAAPLAADAFTHAAPHGSAGEARYELIAVNARGFRPPRFLRTVELPSNEHATTPVAPEWDPEGFKQTWSLEYRRVAETRPADAAPFAIYLLGVNPPDDATDEELERFNDFYTNVHLPEVAERRHALRAVRYELLREIRPPYQGSPRYLAVYEVSEEAASNRRHVGPPYAKGPDVWQRHTTPWRLWYRRLSTQAR